MKTLGLIGGTTWVSTIDYYRLINKQINERLGGLNSARMLLYSVNFAEFNPPTDPAEWGGLTGKFIEIAQTLQKAGADCIVFCANTPHLISDPVQKNINVPIIHIAEETAKVIAESQLRKVGLLGTRITMEQSFYKDKLLQYGITTLIPEYEERCFIHSSILDEMAKDIFKEETRERYLRIITKLVQEGAEAIVLGCTEIPILIKQKDSPVPLFDTTLIHASAIVNFALSN
ncbi:MAG TPA: aspartate/glutamate racemase family protein [Ignavibacteriaceae bacterium]|nr:aspartate/glutamate racemase family protein [Ignavibacteriaceae bacterium]